MSLLSNIDPSTAITWFVTVAIPAGIAIFTAYKNKGLKGAFSALCDLMNPYVEQTSEQTDLIASGKVPDATWKMSDSNFNRMYAELVKSGASLNKDALRSCVNQLEAKGLVEYGLSCYDHDQNPKTDCKWAFVSYGVPEILDYVDVQVKCNNHKCAPICCSSD